MCNYESLAELAKPPRSEGMAVRVAVIVLLPRVGGSSPRAARGRGRGRTRS